VAAVVKRSDTEGGAPLLVLGKLTSILDAFTRGRPLLRRGEIREVTGLPASTCNRLVQNLIAEAVLEEQDGRYRIGAKVLAWSVAASSALDVATVLAPVIERLRDSTGESAAVYVARGLSRTCVAVAPTRHAVIWQLHVGMSTPLYVGSGGRALLAFDREAAREVLGGDRERYTEHTITGAAALRETLRHVRETGIAVSEEELDHDVAGLSSPVFAADGAVAASVGVAGPAQRFTPPDVARYVPAVRGAAREASTLLGGTFPPGFSPSGESPR
jgi:DNA-binding IclR family transcriptional regulator